MAHYRDDQHQLFAVPTPVFDYLDALLPTLAPPTGLADRNAIQGRLTALVTAEFGLNPVDALFAVGGAYAEVFPHPA